MKRAISAICIALIALAAVMFAALLPCGVAFGDQGTEFRKVPAAHVADSAYAGVSSVVFEKNGEKFYIPESYYFECSSVPAIGSYYEVHYMGMDFYIDKATRDKTVAETPDDPDAANIFPSVVLTLKQASASSVEAILGGSVEGYTFMLAGYGADGDGNLNDALYVIATPSVGERRALFLSGDLFENFVVPYQSKTQAERDALVSENANPLPAPEAGALPAPSGSLALKVVLILGITISALIIVILLFVPNKNNRSYVRKSQREGNSFDYDDPRNDSPRDGDNR